MVPPPQKVVVMLENPVSVIHPRLSRIVDYTAIVAKSSIAGAFFYLILYTSASCDTVRRELHSPSPNDKPMAWRWNTWIFCSRGQSPSSAPLRGISLLLELVACAKHLGCGTYCTCLHSAQRSVCKEVSYSWCSRYQYQMVLCRGGS